MKVSKTTGISDSTFAAAVLDMAGSVTSSSETGSSKNSGKKKLFSIRDLKQYFPVKGHKNMFVKANDGISIDIFEGETLGLVGESGCGKSTFGRTILQLYRQTEGHTIFYGQSLEKISPKYLYESINKLSEKKQKLLKLYTENRKAAQEMFFDFLRIFGGLLLYPNEDEVIAAYTEYYNTDNDKKNSKILDALRKTAAEKNINGFNDLEKLRDDGINLAHLAYNEMRHLRKDMQIIFQDPYSSLNPRMTVGQIIGEGPLAHGFFTGEGEALQDHIIQVMEDCGLAPYMIHRYPHQFSGGQRQRIGIARSLAVKPKFVVCDEAVSALDVSIQSQILNLLSDLKEKENLTYLFISHDLSVIKYISDRIGVMYLGNIVEIAKSEDIIDDKILIDCGIGFQKNTEQNLTCIANLDKFSVLGYSQVLGASNKSFVGDVLGADISERVEGTTVATIFGVLKGVMFIRVHNILANKNVIKMTKSILQCKKNI